MLRHRFGNMRDCAVVVAFALLLLSSESAGAASEMWVNGDGRPTPDAEEALTLLRTATVDGLRPDDYRSVQLDPMAAALGQGRADMADRFDSLLTANMVRYLHDLHSGRVDPRAAGFRMTAPPDHHDFGALLREAVATHRLPELAAELAPPFQVYRALREALARYRDLATGTPSGRLPLPERTIRPGDRAVGLTELRRFLAPVGDMTVDVSDDVVSEVYDGPLVSGVMRFQMRHGLDADGVIGPRTRAALHVPLSTRIRQIELALERLRWLPHPGEGRLIALNIPMFRMWAWNTRPADLPALDMEVIVGRALNTQTPAFLETMESVIFRPYWNVPASIVRSEILPRIARDATYLDRQNMEVVDAIEGAQVVPPTPGNLERLRLGALRLRQRPGPNNALGLVKFAFPNDENIYMHGTPEVQLFGRSRRDFSHGCVRVADPIRLAEWVLAQEPRGHPVLYDSCRDAGRHAQVRGRHLQTR